MPPMWNQAESEAEGIYKPVERHSAGMISFAYETAASEEVLEALKDTATFKHPSFDIQPHETKENGTQSPHSDSPTAW